MSRKRGECRKACKAKWLIYQDLWLEPLISNQGDMSSKPGGTELCALTNKVEDPGFRSSTLVTPTWYVFPDIEHRLSGISSPAWHTQGSRLICSQTQITPYCPPANYPSAEVTADHLLPVPLQITPLQKSQQITHCKLPLSGSHSRSPPNVPTANYSFEDITEDHPL